MLITVTSGIEQIQFLFGIVIYLFFDYLCLGFAFLVLCKTYIKGWRPQDLKEYSLYVLGWPLVLLGFLYLRQLGPINKRHLKGET